MARVKKAQAGRMVNKSYDPTGSYMHKEVTRFGAPKKTVNKRTIIGVLKGAPRVGVPFGGRKARAAMEEIEKAKPPISETMKKGGKLISKSKKRK